MYMIEKKLKLADDIIRLSRSTLIVNMRFIDGALSRLTDIPYVGTFASNGEKVFYDPDFLMSCYKTSRELLVRNYFHVLLHCIFRNNLVSTLYNEDTWNLACDIAVENIINELDLSVMDTGLGSKQNVVADTIKKKVKYMTAEKIYSYLTGGNVSESFIEKNSRLFAADDHSL